MRLAEHVFWLKTAYLHANKKPSDYSLGLKYANQLVDYLFITYIVTSKPKRISVAAGVVHIIFSLVCYTSTLMCLYDSHYTCWFDLCPM